MIFVVITILFFMMRAIGGDPFRHGPLFGLSNVAWVKYGDPQPAAIQDNLERRYGLDLPWYRQYANYLEGVFTLRLGPSLSFRNRTVTDVIEEHAPNSLELALLAFTWSLVVGIPAGVIAALRAGSLVDAAIRLFSSVGFALPNFLVATVLIYSLSVKLGWFPTSGWSDSWRHKVLPSFTLSLVPMAYCARLLRGAMLETLQADYVRTARAKGLRRPRIVARHVLRNSLIPFITAAGPLLGYMITSAFVIETIFSVPGIARYFIAAVLARDYPLVMGISVLLAVLIVLANLVVDVLHALLDPRVAEAR